MARVELSGINKSYGAQRALRDLNLVVENGEFFVLLGRHGRGQDHDAADDRGAGKT